MSKFTTEVRSICEVNANKDESFGGDSVEEIVNSAYLRIFWPSLELFDANYKAILFPKILLHYYTREIGFETVGLWKLKLNTRMKEILPYYNQLYNSALIKFSPFDSMDLSRSHVLQHSGQNDGDNTMDGVSRNLFSDTPQGALTNVENETYLTTASKTINNTTSDYTDNLRYSDVYQELLKGNSGIPKSRMLNEFRTTFLNIDNDVIKELKDLFMNIW